MMERIYFDEKVWSEVKVVYIVEYHCLHVNCVIALRNTRKDLTSINTVL